MALIMLIYAHKQAKPTWRQYTRTHAVTQQAFVVLINMQICKSDRQNGRTKTEARIVHEKWPNIRQTVSKGWGYIRQLSTLHCSFKHDRQTTSGCLRSVGRYSCRLEVQLHWRLCRPSWCASDWREAFECQPSAVLLDQFYYPSVRTENKGLLALFSVHQMRWIAYNFKSEITETGSLSEDNIV